MNELVYDFNCHRLGYTDRKYLLEIKDIFFVIDKMEINWDIWSGNILSVVGFLPLINATKGDISIPNCSNEEYKVKSPVSVEEYLKGVGYNYFDYFPESEKYFVTDVTLGDRLYKRVLTKIQYDEENKIILLGNMDRNDKAIRINKNYIFGFDEKDNLKFIHILVDKIIK